MELSFWSDKEQLFVRRQLGFGWSINFKFIAKRVGLIKAASKPPTSDEQDNTRHTPLSRKDLLRRQIEASKYEERR